MDGLLDGGPQLMKLGKRQRHSSVRNRVSKTASATVHASHQRWWALCLGAVVLLFVSVIAISTAGGATLTTGEQVPGTVLPVGTVTAGTPFSSGQSVEVSVPANSLFTHNESVLIVECNAPNGVLPTLPSACDTNTNYGNTILPNADGSFDIKDYPIYSLPSASFGETASNPTQCNLGNECVLYIGLSTQDFTANHIFSQGFYVSPTPGDTGADPGDGSAPSQPTAPSASLSTVSASPTTAVADGVDSSTVTVTGLGTNSENATVPVATGTAVSLTASSTTAVITPAAGTTDANGVATFTVTDKTPEGVTLHATVGTTAITQTAAVTFAAPVVSPTASKIVASPAAVAADGTTTSTLTVTLADQGATAGPVSGQVVSVTQDTGASSTITAVSATTNANGVATFTVTDTTAEQVTYTAKAGSVTLASPATVTFGSLTVSGSASTVVALQSPAGIGVDAGTTVTVTLKTASGSPVEGRSVTLASPSLTATIQPTSGISGADGTVAFTVTDSAAESATFTATDATDSTQISQTATVVFQASQGPTPSSTLSSLVITPSSVTADGLSTANVLVTVNDSNGNPLAGKTVNVGLTVPDVKVTITPILPSGTGVAGVTGSGGLAEFQVRDTVAESVTITATDVTDNNLVLAPTAPSTITFTSGPVDGTASTITASPTAVDADGTTASTISVVLNDHFGNPVAGKTVTLSEGDGHAVIHAVSPVTQTNGTATFTVTDTTPEFVEFEATDVDDTDLAVSSTVTVTFGTPPPIQPAAADCVIVSSASSVPADGKSTATISVLLFDANGLPVSGRTVTLQSSSAAAAVSPSAVATDSTGAAAFTVSDTKAESVTFTATDSADSLVIPGSTTVSFTPATVTAPASGTELNQPIVGVAASPDGRGYWLVASDGGIFSFGDATFQGSTGALHLNKPIVGMASSPDGKGYWLVASDGGIFSFGDATFQGSTGALHLNKPIVGMASSPDGKGYWLVASDGGIFSFGDATFHGSTGSLHLNQPIVGMASTGGGKGYWLVASDGGIFSFGDATFEGSTGALHLNKPVVGMAPTGDSRGYWLAASDGGVFNAGDATFFGSKG
jgi:hypothetical protein